MQARLGRNGAGVLAGRVGDRDGGEQPSGGTERCRDEHRGPESRGEGVRILSEPYKLGDTRAIMIEGPSLEAIELVQV